MDEERRLEGLEPGRPHEIVVEGCREETEVHEQTSETKI